MVPQSEETRDNEVTILADTEVVMVTYNGERYVSEQLTSILRQSSLPARVLVSDDGSTDGTLSALSNAAAGAQVPVLVDSHQNVGLNRNLAGVLERTSASYIALADQDDVWAVGKLKTLSDRIRGLSSVAAVFSDAEIINQDGTAANRGLWAEFGVRRSAVARIEQGDALRDLLMCNVVTGATMLCTRELVELGTPIPEGVLHDYWFALLAAVGGDLIGTSKRLMAYRVHDANTLGVPARTVASTVRLSLVQQPRLREALVVEAVIYRLKERGVAVSDSTAAQLRAKLEFSRARASIGLMSASDRARWSTRALTDGRYRRFSRSALRGVVFDLIVSPRSHRR